ncbi:40S ribosomal protein S5-1 [Hordeum vulgare]|nr:40S ribosomal protein S5-1 [Hordeum vulgare]
MASVRSSKDKFYENVINPYLPKVMKHSQEVVTCEGVFHIRDVQGTKRTGSMKERLEAVDQEIFKCNGMVERGLSANHSMITAFMHEKRVGGQPFENIVLKLNDCIEYLQYEIYDLECQSYEYEEKFRVHVRAPIY